MLIETLLDVEEVSFEELVGRLKAAEERHGLTGSGIGVAQLNLTEDELVALLSKKLHINDDKGLSLGSSGFLPGGQRSGRSGGRGFRDRSGGLKKKAGTGERDRRSDGARAGGNGEVAGDQCRSVSRAGIGPVSAPNGSATDRPMRPR